MGGIERCEGEEGLREGLGGLSLSPAPPLRTVIVCGGKGNGVILEPDVSYT